MLEAKVGNGPVLPLNLRLVVPVEGQEQVAWVLAVRKLLSKVFLGKEDDALRNIFNGCRKCFALHDVRHRGHRLIEGIERDKQADRDGGQRQDF
ncbi:hypothetical protein SDC9_86779 [bioreactor metagenome]|uniref:Uncharacterized protein n=1 Tax=bioreactor metagenome TaxID=1076179 RepID=A0A644ZH06_9ZZZZ